MQTVFSVSNKTFPHNKQRLSGSLTQWTTQLTANVQSANTIHAIVKFDFGPAAPHYVRSVPIDEHGCCPSNCHWRPQQVIYHGHAGFSTAHIAFDSLNVVAYRPTLEHSPSEDDAQDMLRHTAANTITRRRWMDPHSTPHAPTQVQRDDRLLWPWLLHWPSSNPGTRHRRP